LSFGWGASPRGGAPQPLNLVAVMIEFASGLLAVLLTLALLSYLVADNPLYRSAVHLFVGLSAGYAVVLAWHLVIGPQMLAPLRGTAGASALVVAIVTAALGVLLLLKTLRVATRPGSLVVALMVGIGAAVAIGGAIGGTLVPQTRATFVSLLPLEAGSGAGEAAVEGFFIVLGTVTTLGFFYYGARSEQGGPPERPGWVKPIAAVGQVFIGIAFGVLFAGALASSLAVFADRTAAIWAVLGRLGAP
jgi:hypothetical protein